MYQRPVNGPVLAGLAQAYVTAINQGAVPCIENAWTYVCQAQGAQALKEAQECFQAALER